jgi:undecaprenyl-diphosphatase
MTRRRASFLLALLAAIWLAMLALGGEASVVDRSAHSWIYAPRETPLVMLALLVTFLGDWLFLIPLAFACGAVLFWRGRRRDAVALIATVASIRILVILQKEWFDRARPDVEHWSEVAMSSFPSGHAANSAATYLALALLLSGRRAAVIAASLLALAIGLSRIFLGVHWPSDVLGGWAIGSAGALICAIATGQAGKRGGQEIAR